MTKRNRKKSTAKKAAVGQKPMTRLGTALRSLGGLGGGAIGGLVGQGVIGAGLGTSLGAALSKWLGSGDYRIARNSIVTSTGSIPAMHSGNQSVTIRHKEYLGPINSSTNFTIQMALTLNPGLGATFPWLSGIANSFQEYYIKGMVFHYIPTSGDAISSTNNALGTVIMQTSYRANDSAPSSKLTMLNEYYACEAKPSDTFCHPIECNPKENPFNIHYVRSLAVPAKDSPLMYDMGITWIATAGMQASNIAVGDLWVTYEIELSKPIVSSNVTSNNNAIGSRSLFTGITSASQLFTSLTYTTGDIEVTFYGASNTILLPPGLNGNFHIMVELTSGPGFTTFTWSANATATNCTLINRNVEMGVGAGTFWSNSTYDSGNITSPSSTTLSRGFYLVEVFCSASLLQPTILIPSPTIVGTCSYVSVTVLRIS